MKIFYFSKNFMPSHSEQSFYEMKLCEALANAKKDSKVTLLAQSLSTTQNEDVFFHYQVKQIFTLVLGQFSKNNFLSWYLRKTGFNWYIEQAGRMDLACSNDPLLLYSLSLEKTPIALHLNSRPSLLEKYVIKKLSRNKDFYIFVDSETKKISLEKIFPELKEKIFTIDQALTFEKKAKTLLKICLKK